MEEKGKRQGATHRSSKPRAQQRALYAGAVVVVEDDRHLALVKLEDARRVVFTIPAEGRCDVLVDLELAGHVAQVLALDDLERLWWVRRGVRAVEVRAVGVRAVEARAVERRLHAPREVEVATVEVAMVEARSRCMVSLLLLLHATRRLSRRARPRKAAQDRRRQRGWR